MKIAVKTSDSSRVCCIGTENVGTHEQGALARTGKELLSTDDIAPVVSVGPRNTTVPGPPQCGDLMKILGTEILLMKGNEEKLSAGSTTIDGL